MNWDDLAAKVQRNSNSGSGSGLFVSLKDGDSVIMAFAGEPYDRTIHWDGGQSVPCMGADCGPCARGVRKSMRVATNVWVPSEGEYKVFEQGLRFFEQLLDVRKKRPLDEWLFEVTRKGTGMDTRYHILPEDRIDSKTAGAMADMDLVDLDTLFAKLDDRSIEKAADNRAPADASVPF